MSEGYIKLYRKSVDCCIWQNIELWHFWCRLLMMATHRDREILVGNQLVQLKAGQLVTGRKKLSELEKCSERNIRTMLKTLENLRMISIKSTNRFSIITIENWAFYQDDDQQSDQQKTNKRPTSDQQVTTNKNVKNVKNEKNNKYIEDEALNSAFLSFVEMRKSLKKPLTSKAAELAIAKLNELSNGDNETALKIIEQSVLNSWLSFYPLKAPKEQKEKKSAYSSLEKLILNN